MAWYLWLVLAGLVLIAGYLAFAGYMARARRRLLDRTDLPGVPFDGARAMNEVAEGTRPGLIEDGRYWYFHCIRILGEMRLVEEGPATEDEVQDHLASLGEYHGTPPVKEKRDPLDPDGPSGIFSVKGENQPNQEWLMVVHPGMVGSGQRYDQLQRQRGRSD